MSKDMPNPATGIDRNTTSRRDVLAGAAGIAAAGALWSAPALAAIEPSPLLLEHRRLRKLVRSIEAEMSALPEPHRLSPAMGKLEDELDIACADVNRAAKAIWDTPVRSMVDLHARLESPNGRASGSRASIPRILTNARPWS